MEQKSHLRRDLLIVVILYSLVYAARLILRTWPAWPLSLLNSGERAWLTHWTHQLGVMHRDIWCPGFFALVAVLLMSSRKAPLKYLAVTGITAAFWIIVTTAVGSFPRLSPVQVLDGNEYSFLMRVAPVAVAGFVASVLAWRGIPFSPRVSWLFIACLLALAIVMPWLEKGESQTFYYLLYGGASKASGTSVLLLVLSGLWFGGGISPLQFVAGVAGILGATVLRGEAGFFLSIYRAAPYTAMVVWASGRMQRPFSLSAVLGGAALVLSLFGALNSYTFILIWPKYYALLPTAVVLTVFLLDRVRNKEGHFVG